MIAEIQAKTMLSSWAKPDPMFGLRYNMNLYRGCAHQCIYCDSRSECYGIENFADILVKVNAIELLERELPTKRKKGLIGTGSMNDPYQPVEATYQLTRRALAVIAQWGFPVSVLTKSDLALRDLDVLQDVNKVRAVVSYTITAADDELARKLEPGAPPTSARFAAIAKLAAAGIETGIMMMPILPFILDSEENIREIVRRGVDAGARHILPGFGMTMRDRQRAWYYARLDERFPGLRARYERAYGESYGCPSPQARRLDGLFRELQAKHGFADHLAPYEPPPGPEQLALF